MVDNIVTKPLGLVLIITANMVLNGPSHAVVIGALGSNISLSFTFNNSLKDGKFFSIYTKGETKIGDDSSCKSCFDIHESNSSVVYHISNLNQNHSNIYWATFILPEESGVRKSHILELIVRTENRTTTVPPTTTPATTQNSGNYSSFHIITVLVVSPLVLCAAVLPFLIYCLIKSKDKQPPQQGSNSTVQETIEESSHVPAPPLVYSILDFPKRPPAPVVELNPSDTEYAAVSYVTEKRKM
ncbi:uncharacterized protein LOC125009817 [Mugil cephalus]|uniref:uncharacterized protein LOC125009817 n=1 Tax=Mugil cephalus TaxID=48193 RepID=UPI001FB6F636|nr:uncharacterized protein LOC125009817 [Mugil cephalus]